MSRPLVDSNPLLYPRSKEPFNSKLFTTPTAEYRGSPLWSWNNALDPVQLLRQIDQLAEMGMGGFHMHSRVGLDTAYMGSVFMECVRACVDKARDKGLLACLYDEDRWPSGAAGGLVTKGHPELGSKHLLLTTKKYGEMENPHLSQSTLASAIRSEDGRMVARYDIRSTGDGVHDYSRVPLDADASTELDVTTWYAYVEGNPPSEWYNAQTYVDTLSPSAIARFIQLTHEQYYAAVGKDFGSVVPSIFCDEPQFSHKAQLVSSSDTKDLFFPWTEDLVNTFLAANGFDILDRLPEIVWDTVSAPDPQNPSIARYLYHEHVCERFVSAFMDQLSSWCRDHGIALTGHMMQEPTLRSQTETLGEAMRCYRNLDVPGIDILHDALELNTAKQAASVSRQRNGGRGGVMSELYGVTNWTFDFTGYKGSGDWQAAMGITFRVPHLSPVSLAGEGKRDYPAAIGYQAPWYREWRYIEDHFARVNVALTRGKSVTRVAVIHPIESFWLCFGPLDRNADEQVARIDDFERLTEWLLYGLIDFDFISESLFPDQTSLEDIGTTLPVGHCTYDVVIVPNMRTIRSTTLTRLSKFVLEGGTVLVAGHAPTLVDARSHLSSMPGQMISFNRLDILKSLEPWRELKVIEHWGTPAENLLYQIRRDGDYQYIFICNVDREKELTTTVSIRGEWEATVLESLTGAEWSLRTTVRNGFTEWAWTFEGASSLLVQLSPISNEKVLRRDQVVYRKSFGTLGPVVLDKVSLSEPNVLLLDMAEWRLGEEEEWNTSCEVLRIDNLVRKRLEFPLKLERYRQPWSIPMEDRQPRAMLHLRLMVVCMSDVVSALHLALERPEDMTIRWDGRVVSSKRTGWWVDEDISTILVQEPGDVLTAGTHVLELDIPFGLITNIERVYLLGEFAVDVRGKEVRIIGPLDLSGLTFGDWTKQGLPFYAGNVEYHCSFSLPETCEAIAIDVPQYDGPIVTSILDSDPDSKRHLTLHPAYTVYQNLGPGQHSVIFKAFGNRENSFGTIHLPIIPPKNWHGPNAWRYEFDWWCDEYNIKKMGIVQAPKIKVPGEDVPTVRRSKVQKWYN